MDLDRIQSKLGEWKERILFGVVVIATVWVARHGVPMLGGDGISQVEAAARRATLSAAGLSDQAGDAVREKLQNPPDVTPTPVEPRQVTGLFFDERDGFVARLPSGWQLGQENFERLPPVALTVPGFPVLTDFDLPAGAMPALDRARGSVPRDARRVQLTTEETSEFRD